MGLGKTIQTISLISLLIARKRTTKPYLIIVPAIVLENWSREFASWAPTIKVIMYHGAQKEREVARKKIIKENNFDVLLTTYNLAISKVDRKKLFKKFEFSYIVLDEAHGIKNIKSNRYKILIKLAQKADYRLMLTGTPLQNNFLELWALLNFLMPKVFGDVENFDELLKLPVEDQDENDPQIKRLKQIISPFLLRRLKSDVLASLPPKTLSTIWCNFTTPQSKIYQSIFALSKSKFASLQREKEERDKKKLQDSQNSQNNSQNSQDMLIDDHAQLKKEKSLQITTEIKEIDENENENEKENILQNEPVSLHHILMQLRKGANNALLFRSIYTDEDLLKIQNAYNAIKGKEKGIPLENQEGKNEEKEKEKEK